MLDKRIEQLNSRNGDTNILELIMEENVCITRTSGDPFLCTALTHHLSACLVKS